MYTSPPGAYTRRFAASKISASTRLAAARLAMCAPVYKFRTMNLPGSRVQMTRAAVETDRIGARVQFDGADRRERPVIEKLDGLAAVGNEQPVRLPNGEYAVGSLEASDASQMLAGAQIEYLECAVILGRE